MKAPAPPTGFMDNDTIRAAGEILRHEREWSEFRRRTGEQAPQAPSIATIENPTMPVESPELIALRERQAKLEAKLLDRELDRYGPGKSGEPSQADVVEAFGDAFLIRAGLPPADPHPMAREFAHGVRRMSLADFSAVHAGLDMYRAPVADIRASLNASDFGESLASAMSRVIGIDYSRQSSEHSQVLFDLPVKGMRPATLPVLDLGELQKIPGAGGPINLANLSVSEGGTVRPYIWSARFIVSRELLVNDDLGVISLAARQLGGHCSRLEASRIAALLIANVNLSDGAPLIGAGNSTASVGLTANSLSEGLGLLRTRTTPAGNVANVRGKYLLVPGALEGLALQAANLLCNGNEPRLTVVVNSWLTGNSCYLLSDPLESPVFVRSYPEGFEPVPTIERVRSIADPETGEPFYFDGQAFRAEHIVGIDAVDRMGIVKITPAS